MTWRNLWYFIIYSVISRCLFKVSPKNISSVKEGIINLYDDFFEGMNDTFTVRLIRHHKLYSFIFKHIISLIFEQKVQHDRTITHKNAIAQSLLTKTWSPNHHPKNTIAQSLTKNTITLIVNRFAINLQPIC